MIIIWVCKTKNVWLLRFPATSYSAKNEPFWLINQKEIQPCPINVLHLPLISPHHSLLTCRLMEMKPGSLLDRCVPLRAKWIGGHLLCLVQLLLLTISWNHGRIANRTIKQNLLFQDFVIKEMSMKNSGTLQRENCHFKGWKGWKNVWFFHINSPLSCALRRREHSLQIKENIHFDTLERQALCHVE